MSIVIGLFVSFPLMIMCAFLLPEVGIPMIFLIKYNPKLVFL